jgi:Nucleotidyl transferase AbiEii toxin, Type IV TA system
MGDEKLSGFILVGGTALALQIGHRMSVDIDLFATKEFDRPVFSQVKDIKDVFLMKGKFDWDKIKSRIVEMTNNPSKVLKPMQLTP